jgi:hypothetical protein
MSEARSHGTAATPYRPPVCGRGCAVRGKVSVGGWRRGTDSKGNAYAFSFVECHLLVFLGVGLRSDGVGVVYPMLRSEGVLSHRC